MFTYQKVYQAYLDCRKNKRNTKSALLFEMNLENNLYSVLKELKSKSYRPGRATCFVVTEPVPREIMASDFRDRVVHHLILREISQVAEKRFISNSFACRKGKGTHKAVAELNRSIKKASKNGKNEVFCMKLDIKGFFMSINHQKLFELIENLLEKKSLPISDKNHLLWLAKVIIFHKYQENYFIKGDKSLMSLIPKHKSFLSISGGKGIPIGNYTSQFFANLYLNELDQYVKRVLKANFYIRYMDDYLILSESKESLKDMKNKISIFLENKLFMILNDKKTTIQAVSKGVEFLGYFIKPNYTLVGKRVVKRFKRKIFLNKKDDISLSYFGHFSKANAYNLLSKYGIM